MKMPPLATRRHISDIPDVRAAQVAARLRPELNEPFFVITQYSGAGCSHKEVGVRLDVPTRRVYCACGVELDAFDALLIYAHAEYRLVNATIQLAKQNEKEQQVKARAKERRPFQRRVVGQTPNRDMSLKHEPVVSQTLKLECGHTTKRSNDVRIPRNVSCAECEQATKPALPARRPRP